MIGCLSAVNKCPFKRTYYAVPLERIVWLLLLSLWALGSGLWALVYILYLKLCEFLNVTDTRQNFADFVQYFKIFISKFEIHVFHQLFIINNIFLILLMSTFGVFRAISCAHFFKLKF